MGMNMWEFSVGINILNILKHCRRICGDFIFTTVCCVVCYLKTAVLIEIAAGVVPQWMVCAQMHCAWAQKLHKSEHKITWWSGPLLHMACMSQPWFLFQF